MKKNKKDQRGETGSLERASGYATNARSKPAKKWNERCYCYALVEVGPYIDNSLVQINLPESTTSETGLSSTNAICPKTEKIANPANTLVRQFVTQTKIASE